MRNPYRIVDFLNCLLPYEGQVPTHEVIMKVIQNAIKGKLYKPVVINHTPDLLVVYKDEENKFNNTQIEYIIEMRPQKRKEAGFAYGLDSRFDTIFKLPMKFGFVEYAMG